MRFVCAICCCSLVSLEWAPSPLRFVLSSVLLSLLLCGCLCALSLSLTRSSLLCACVCDTLSLFVCLSMSTHLHCSLLALPLGGPLLSRCRPPCIFHASIPVYLSARFPLVVSVSCVLPLPHRSLRSRLFFAGGVLHSVRVCCSHILLLRSSLRLSWSLGFTRLSFAHGCLSLSTCLTRSRHLWLAPSLPLSAPLCALVRPAFSPHLLSLSLHMSFLLCSRYLYPC